MQPDTRLTREADPAAWEPRSVCMRCRRPSRVCWCAHLTSIETKTRVVLLQHPRERDVAIGTARMASLCLPNSELHVGVKFDQSAELAKALSDPSRPAALLYPSDGATDVVKDPPKGPITLVVVDGTWWQAKKLIRENPHLAALPKLAFTPEAPSEYRIRREPAPEYVSTIEALMHVLSALEGEPERFQALLTPFRAMVDMQIEHAETLQDSRQRNNKKGPKPPSRNAMSRLRENAENLLCITAEANAWPYSTDEGQRTPPDEIVMWSAYRPSTGETFELVVAPERPLAPRTPSQTGIAPEDILAGASREELLARWSAFARDTDVVCAWGPFATRVFETAGGTLPSLRFDVRQIARDRVQGKVGSMEQVLESLGLPANPTPMGQGRGGRRLAQLGAVVRAFAGIE